jgi:hypothetical protein
MDFYVDLPKAGYTMKKVLEAHPMLILAHT